MIIIGMTVLGMIVIGLGLWFVWAFCRSAAIGDRQLENLNCNRDEMNDLTYYREE